MDIERKLLELEVHGGECPEYIRQECSNCGVCWTYIEIKDKKGD